MTRVINCEVVSEDWDYDTCIECRRFSVTVTDKGRKWRCKLNSGTASEKRNFYTIWAEDFLIARGVMEEESRSNVEINYVGKKKGRKPLPQ